MDARQRAAFRARAEALERLDIAAYHADGKDPLEPIIGLGDADTRIGFFGRDPGRAEIRYGTPFIGAGGQKLRKALYHHLHGREMPDFDASVAVGRGFFWANTVPYKPAGNKAWPMTVKKAFHGLIAELLVRSWRGADLITLGREAFLWFGIGQPPEIRAALAAFWCRPDRFTATTAVPLTLQDGTSRSLRLHPLPHPSPLNATWYKRFPDLLKGRLEQLDVRPDSLRVCAQSAETMRCAPRTLRAPDRR